MTDEASRKLALLTQKMDEHISRGETAEDHIRRITKAARDIGLDSYVGWINHAGRVVDGTYQVQFDVPGDGYSSRWPAWAYEAALPAVVHKKKVWVISNGVPFGKNLLQVLIFGQDA